MEEWAGTKVCFINNEQSWHKAYFVGIEDVTPPLRSSSECRRPDSVPQLPNPPNLCPEPWAGRTLVVYVCKGGELFYFFFYFLINLVYKVIGFILSPSYTVCFSEKHFNTVRNLLKSLKYKELSSLVSCELLILSPFLHKTLICIGF